MRGRFYLYLIYLLEFIQKYVYIYIYLLPFCSMMELKLKFQTYAGICIGVLLLICVELLFIR